MQNKMLYKIHNISNILQSSLWITKSMTRCSVGPSYSVRLIRWVTFSCHCRAYYQSRLSKCPPPIGLRDRSTVSDRCLQLLRRSIDGRFRNRPRATVFWCWCAEHDIEPERARTTSSRRRRCRRKNCRLSVWFSACAASGNCQLPRT